MTPDHEPQANSDDSQEASMSSKYPEFQLRLPNDGPIARGRLLDEMGSRRSRKFLVLARAGL